MIVAVVDVGTNSTRLLIADVRDGRIARELERRTNVTRLGEGVDESGRLSDEAVERVLAACASYREAIDAAGAERVVAVLTSAVRDAAERRRARTRSYASASDSRRRRSRESERRASRSWARRRRARTRCR